MDCSVVSWNWWECWLCIWLWFPWWSKWQKAPLGSPTVSRHDVCLPAHFCSPPPPQFPSHCDVQQPAIQSEMPLRPWIVIIWETGCTLPQWGGGVVGQPFTVAQKVPSNSSRICCFPKPLNSELMWKHDRSLTLTSWPFTPLFASCHHPHSVDATGFMTNRQLEEWTEKLILCSSCIYANKGLTYWIILC